MKRYDPKEIEPRWQGIWDETGIYTADLKSTKPKYVAMSMFNYPSGAGIHIGHAMNYTISDVKARFKRQQGYESYHPVGWDAFGLPAENYAIKAGVSPQESMATIIPSYHKQYKAMGWSNDWEKEIATHLPEYYKWTQWIFTQMFKHGLAYQDSRMQWWCTKCQTVLANEQVIDGKCWRHDGPDDPLVEKKEVKQWFFKITEYADELLDAIDGLDWTETVKLAQKNWIGKSKGAEITFAVDGSNETITVFTTRPDTLFGVTFMVLAPELEIVSRITTAEQRQAVDDYIVTSGKKSEVERQAGKEKTGIFTGAYALNPVNGEKLPIWIADYVLAGYGTGAIMAVPAHDERDNEFAQTYELPITEVVAPEFGERRDDEEWADGATVIVYDETADKYLGLDWKQGWIGLVAGGIDEGESYEACARRELQEEAGIAAGKELFSLGGPVFAHYQHRVKGMNRIAKTQGYLAIVPNNRNTATKHEPHETFSNNWYTFDELYNSIEKRLTGNGHWLELLSRAQKAVQAYRKQQPMPTLYTMNHEEGVMINSGKYDGLSSSEAREAIVADLEKQGIGTERINYRMRDWSVSRQRYWGAPIPIVNCKEHGAVLVPDTQLPVVLPELDDFKPSGDGRSALARATDWLQTTCPECGGPAERETDTLDTYICSSWYMYRYFDPRNTEKIFDSTIVKNWEPIDFYNGADHATAHLLYARFIGHFFKKLGLVDEAEPFKQFLFNGKVTAGDGTMFSKSKGNGVDPLEIIGQGYGADALRTYLMFAAPLDMWVRWDPQGVPGAYRFLSRIWTLVQEYHEAAEGTLDESVQKDLRRVTHAMVKKMTEDIQENRYNTAIAAAMGTVNELYKLKASKLVRSEVWQEALEMVVACVAPFAPHIADELWLQLGHHLSVHRDSWPHWNEAYLTQDTVTIAVQVNGKLRGTVEVAAESDEAVTVAAATADAKVAPYLKGKQTLKTIYVPGKLLNFVVK